MALGPKQMAEAIIRNLTIKTGKSLKEWIKILHAANQSNKKDAMDYLKKEHGLGHFQAQTIFAEMTNSNEYKDPDALIETLFSSPAALKSYRIIAKQLSSLGKDVRVQPCKTYIPFYRKNQFAIIKPAADNNLIIGLHLPDDFEHPSFQKGNSGGSERINFQIKIAFNTELDPEIISIIKVAYTNNQ